ncbi:conserved hypothetical protein [delta proteobacterium NaphS2]|nr:conserved hypothetical protein [delta proteobacterium NaphS2]
MMFFASRVSIIDTFNLFKKKCQGVFLKSESGTSTHGQ